MRYNMKVTRRTWTGAYVTEEMTREEYRNFAVHRAVTTVLIAVITILSIVCGTIWLEVLLRL